MVSTHLSAPLRARQHEKSDHPNAALLRELSRRYAAEYDNQMETYDFIELALAAGLKASHTLEFTLKRINSKYYLGSGQTAEVIEHAKESGVDLIALSAPLSPVHQRNWEHDSGLPVLNRYDLIFSIFDENARTAEGKLQVELAHLKYELPRIVRTYEQLDPLAGGIGTLGPGEQLTERIKRRHRRRIYDIEQRLGKLRQQRELRRRQRARSGIYIASIVGFTNVGKSTLLNRLTGSGVLVADQYFATLDPTARALRLPSGDKILLTDTVGFLDDLPKELLSSFMATLEEMEGSQLLVHLADASHSQVDWQIESVRRIIKEIGLGETPELLVFNKCDRIDQALRQELASQHPDALFISALDKSSLGVLLATLEEHRMGSVVPRV